MLNTVTVNIHSFLRKFNSTGIHVVMINWENKISLHKCIHREALNAVSKAIRAFVFFFNWNSESIENTLGGCISHLYERTNEHKTLECACNNYRNTRIVSDWVELRDWRNERSARVCTQTLYTTARFTYVFSPHTICGSSRHRNGFSFLLNLKTIFFMLQNYRRQWELTRFPRLNNDISPRDIL